MTDDMQLKVARELVAAQCVFDACGREFNDCQETLNEAVKRLESARSRLLAAKADAIALYRELLK